MTIEMSRRQRFASPLPALPAEPQIALVADEVYAVLSPTDTMGFVWRAGNVYVAAEGPDLARAFEIGQSLSWDIAVEMVQRARHSH